MNCAEYSPRYRKEKRSWIKPTIFVKASRPSWFLQDRQQDCSEFLKYLLNQLHDDDILSNTDMSPKNDNVLLTSLTLKMEEDKSSRHFSFDCGKSTQFVQSLVENHFSGKLKTILKCLACGQKSVTVETFFDISLSFPNSSKLTPHLCKSLAGNRCASFGEQEAESIQVVEAELAVQPADDLSLNDLISYYLTSEKLTEDNKYQCDQCRTLQDGERSLQIIICPEYLILTLLRFSYDSTLGRMTKVFKDVSYPCTMSIPVYKEAASEDTSSSSTHNTTGAGDSHLAKLDNIAKLIAPKCDSCNQEPQSFQLYGLTAVIVHSGSSSECGHFFCFARHAQDGQVDVSLLEECKMNNLDNLDLLPDKWYRFNDKNVTSCTLNSFRNGIKTKDTAYILIYRKLYSGSQNKGSDTDPALSPGLMDAVIKDNEAYLKEQEAQDTMFQGAGKWIDDKKDRARNKRSMPQEMHGHKRKK